MRLPTKSTEKKLIEKSLWRALTDFWTIIFFISIIYDYLHDNALDHAGIILVVATLYGASLAVYSAEKEFKRWHDRHTSLHPGELYVFAWTVIVFGLPIASFYYHTSYEIPAEVRATYIVVIGILALTKESKYLYGKDRCER